MNFIKWFPVALIFVLWGCAPSSHEIAYQKAQNAYDNGKDDAALEHVIKSLKMKPDYKPSLKLLGQIYDDVVGSHREAIASLKKNKKKKDRWADIVDHEDQIAKFNKEIQLLIRRNPEIDIEIKSNKKTQEMALDSAAYYYFQYGLAAMENPDKDSQREAARYFHDAMDYRPDYPEAEDLYRECKEKGKMRIVIDKLRGDESGRIDGAIISAMQKDKAAMEFISFLSREDLDRLMQEQDLSLSGDFIEGSGVDMVGKLLDAQYVVVGSIEKVVCAEEPEVQRGSRTVTDTRKVGEKCERKKSGKLSCRDEYETYKATVITDSLMRKSSMSGTIKLLDVATGEIKKTTDIRAGVMSTTEEDSDCRGDRETCRKVEYKPGGSLRSCQELYDQLVVEFTKKAVKGLSTFTKKL